MTLSALLLVVAAASSSFDGLWQRYHEAGDRLGREAAWAELRAAGWPDDFEETLARLRQRSYAADVPTGIVESSRVDFDERRFKYLLLVPESYDPSRSYPLRVILHGSTRRKPWKEGEFPWRRPERLTSEAMITLLPSAWEEAMWWSDTQIENLRALLDAIRARYNVDSNRCHLMGLSDGGTGTFYHALRAPMPWASFLPLIGHPWVLGNREEGADGDIFAANARGRSFLVVNGRDDRLYPAKALPPYLDLLRRAGATVAFREMPGGHDVRWWPEEAASFAEFRGAHARDPFPDSLSWETGSPRTNGRAFWLRILEVDDEVAPDPDPLNTVLFPELDPPTRAEAFPRSGPSGRVEAVREGNTLRVTTRNVRRLELLLGVGELDFSEPVRVILNGTESTYAVAPSLETLMKWAVVDGDPEMLVGASFAVEVP